MGSLTAAYGETCIDKACAGSEGPCFGVKTMGFKGCKSKHPFAQLGLS